MRFVAFDGSRVHEGSVPPRGARPPPGGLARRDPAHPARLQPCPHRTDGSGAALGVAALPRRSASTPARPASDGLPQPGCGPVAHRSRRNRSARCSSGAHAEGDAVRRGDVLFVLGVDRSPRWRATPRTACAAPSPSASAALLEAARQPGGPAGRPSRTSLDQRLSRPSARTEPRSTSKVRAAAAASRPGAGGARAPAGAAGAELHLGGAVAGPQRGGVRGAGGAAGAGAPAGRAAPRDRHAGGGTPRAAAARPRRGWARSIGTVRRSRS